jgi:hypothetical protein
MVDLVLKKIVSSKDYAGIVRFEISVFFLNLRLEFGDVNITEHWCEESPIFMKTFSSSSRMQRESSIVIGTFARFWQRR